MTIRRENRSLTLKLKARDRRWISLKCVSTVEQLSCCRSHFANEFFLLMIDCRFFFFTFSFSLKRYRAKNVLRRDRRARRSENVRSIHYSLILSPLYTPISLTVVYSMLKWTWKLAEIEIVLREKKKSDLFTVLITYAQWVRKGKK